MVDSQTYRALEVEIQRQTVFSDGKYIVEVECSAI